MLHSGTEYVLHALDVGAVGTEQRVFAGCELHGTGLLPSALLTGKNTSDTKVRDELRLHVRQSGGVPPQLGRDQLSYDSIPTQLIKHTLAPLNLFRADGVSGRREGLVFVELPGNLYTRPM